MKAKTIGLLGLGTKSTLFYIEALNAAYSKQNEEQNTLPLHLLNTNFNKINNLLPKPSKELEGIIQNYLNELIKLGVTEIIIPNITLHETIDRLNVSIPIIHPVHHTASEIVNKMHNNVVLFGSEYTMESNYIKSIFKEYNIATIAPSKEDRAFIDVVRKQVYQKTASKDLLDRFNLMIKKYAQNSAVVIACTELSVASTNSSRSIFDMVRIQIREGLKTTS